MASEMGMRPLMERVLSRRELLGALAADCQGQFTGERRRHPDSGRAKIGTEGAGRATRVCGGVMFHPPIEAKSIGQHRPTVNGRAHLVHIMAGRPLGLDAVGR